MSGILKKIKSPSYVKRLSMVELERLAEEIRERLINGVAKTGGHIGPNLGVVELTIAMHYVFDTPVDSFVFDVSHQAYVHKLLTGRSDPEWKKLSADPRYSFEAIVSNIDNLVLSPLPYSQI